MSALNIDDKERQDVIELHERGYQAIEIARRTGINIITVTNIIKKHKKDNKQKPSEKEKPKRIESFKELGKVLSMGNKIEEKKSRLHDEATKQRKASDGINTLCRSSRRNSERLAAPREIKEASDGRIRNVRNN